MKTDQATPAEEKLPLKSWLKNLRNLQDPKNHKPFEAACAKALADYPDSKKLWAESADSAIRQKKWGAAIQRLNRSLRLMDSEDTKRGPTLRKLANVYINLGQPMEASLHIAKALEDRPADLLLRNALAGVSLLTPGGLADPSPWQQLAAAPELATADDATRVRIVAACVAGLRLAGDFSAARALFAAHYNKQDSAWVDHVKDGYSRATIYQNGRTRVEYYTKLFDTSTLEPVEATQLAFTFDTMGQSWNQSPYAYKPLNPLNVDLFSVRKRTRKDFHQDFPREDFLRLALPVARCYPDSVALGQSLGAYCTLYYASWVPGCRILATAPQNPMNPKYSSKSYANYELFRQEYDMRENEASAPTIVYDPKSKDDGPYVRNSLQHAFPNARFVEYPYCGHSIALYLLETGRLKSSTLGFCKGVPFPEFDRDRRRLSSEYFRNLAKMNFAAGRKRWALAMLTKALELGNTQDRTQQMIAKMDPRPPVIMEPEPLPNLAAVPLPTTKASTSGEKELGLIGRLFNGLKK